MENLSISSPDSAGHATLVGEAGDAPAKAAGDVPVAPSLLSLPVEVLEQIVCGPCIDPLHRAEGRRALPAILVVGSVSRVFRDLTLRRHGFWKSIGRWIDLLPGSQKPGDTLVVPAGFISDMLRVPARLHSAFELDIHGSRILPPESLKELLVALRDLSVTRPGLKCQLRSFTLPSLKSTKLDGPFLFSIAEAMGPAVASQLESFNLQNGTKFARNFGLVPSKVSPRPFIRHDALVPFTSALGSNVVSLGLAGLSMAWWPSLLDTLKHCPSIQELDLIGSCFSINTENPPMEDGRPTPVDLAALARVLPNLKSLSIGGASILYTGGLAGFSGLEELLLAPPIFYSAPDSNLEVEEPTRAAVGHILSSVPEGRRTLRRLKFGHGDSHGPWIPLLSRFQDLEEIWNLTWSNRDLGLAPLRELGSACSDPDPEDEEKKVSRLRAVSLIVGERIVLLQPELEEALGALNRAREIVIRRDSSAAWVVLGNYQTHETNLDMGALRKVLPNGCRLVLQDA